MKQFILSALLLGSTVTGFAQNRIGLEVGITAPTFSPGSGNPDNTYRHSADPKPTISAYYLRKIDRHVYLGMRFGVEAQSFYFSNTDSIRVDIFHKSTYLMVAPTLDLGLGPKQHIHIFFDLGMGFLTNANESTQEYAFGNNTNPTYSYNSQDRVATFIFRPGFGLKQHFRLAKNWHLTLKEGFSILANDLTRTANIGGVHPGQLTLQMGVMRKLHRPQGISSQRSE